MKILLALTFVLTLQAFPSRPIELVTHAGPGGGTDITARMAMTSAQKALSWDIELVNKRGGSGALSLAYAARKPRDGHTILTITPSHLFTMARGRTPVEIDQLVGIARAADDPEIVMVRRGSPYQSIEDLLRASKTKSLKWGVTQIGGVDHLAAHSFAKKAGIQLDVVPFKGGGDIVTNLMGENIDVGLLNLAEAASQFESGDILALLVMADERMASLPDVPTAKEKGIDASYSVVRGFAVLEGTPEETVRLLERRLLEALRHPDYQSHLKGVGLSESSVAGRAEWEAQFKKLYEDGLSTMRELGMVR